MLKPGQGLGVNQGCREPQKALETEQWPSARGQSLPGHKSVSGKWSLWSHRVRRGTSS